MGKKLGQHFLKNRKIAIDIVQISNISKRDIILEIGSGRGILTENLLKNAGLVVAYEKDKKLFYYLSERFKNEIRTKKLVLVNDDILNLPQNNMVLAILGCKYKVIANIPYYITGKIFRLILSLESQPNMALLLVQKEVAVRVAARNGKESILSISVKIYSNPKIVMSVRASFFSPPPKVDSALLLLENINRGMLKNVDEDKFFRIVKKGFAKKRKLLKNNLSINDDVLKMCNVKKGARAENLSFIDWICLYKLIQNESS